MLFLNVKKGKIYRKKRPKNLFDLLEAFGGSDGRCSILFKLSRSHILVIAGRSPKLDEIGETPISCQIQRIVTHLVFVA